MVYVLPFECVVVVMATAWVSAVVADVVMTGAREMVSGASVSRELGRADSTDVGVNSVT